MVVHANLPILLFVDEPKVMDYIQQITQQRILKKVMNNLLLVIICFSTSIITTSMSYIIFI